MVKSLPLLCFSQLQSSKVEFETFGLQRAFSVFCGKNTLFCQFIFNVLVRVQVIPFIGFFVSTTSVYKNEIKTRQDYCHFTFIISNHESRYYIFSRGFIIIFLILVIQLKLLLLLHRTEPYVRKTLFQKLRFVSKQLFQTCS